MSKEFNLETATKLEMRNMILKYQTTTQNQLKKKNKEISQLKKKLEDTEKKVDGKAEEKLRIHKERADKYKIYCKELREVSIKLEKELKEVKQTNVDLETKIEEITKENEELKNSPYPKNEGEKEKKEEEEESEEDEKSSSSSEEENEEDEEEEKKQEEDINELKKERGKIISGDEEITPIRERRKSRFHTSSDDSSSRRSYGDGEQRYKIKGLRLELEVARKQILDKDLKIRQLEDTEREEKKGGSSMTKALNKRIIRLNKEYRSLKLEYAEITEKVRKKDERVDQLQDMNNELIKVLEKLRGHFTPTKKKK